MAAVFRAGDVRGLVDGGATTIDSNSFTVAEGDTVYAAIGNSDGTPVSPTSVVWDSVGVNQPFGDAVHNSGTIFTFGNFAVFCASQSLTAKTAVFTATFPSAQTERVILIWAGPGIDINTPHGTIGTGTNTNTSVTATANTIAGQLVLGIGYALDLDVGATVAFTSPNGTERNEGAAAPHDTVASQDITAGGATQAITWTLTGTTASFAGWYAVAIPLNDFVASSAELVVGQLKARTWRPRPFAPGNVR
jgi:hypothetical protein